MNVDEESELAEQFQVMSIPTLIELRGRKTAAAAVGVQPKDAILDLVKNA